jgi:hypothetical protein
MDGAQFLLDLPRREQVEVVVARQPDGLRQVDGPSLRGEGPAEKPLDVDGAAPLPLRLESTDLIGVRERDDGRDMVGQDDEADALAALQGPLGIPHAEDDLIGPVVVEQATTTEAGGRHERGLSLPTVGPLSGHPESVPEAGLALNPRVAARPRTPVVRATRVKQVTAERDLIAAVVVLLRAVGLEGNGQQIIHKRLLSRGSGGHLPAAQEFLAVRPKIAVRIDMPIERLAGKPSARLV